MHNCGPGCPAQLLEDLRLIGQEWTRTSGELETLRSQRAEAIRHGREAGVGYGTMAKALGIPRATVQAIANSLSEPAQTHGDGPNRVGR